MMVRLMVVPVKKDKIVFGHRGTVNHLIGGRCAVQDKIGLVGTEDPCSSLFRLKKGA